MKQSLPNPIDHFFRGAISTNIVLITFTDEGLKVLLQQKEELPYENTLSLPGRFILPNEDTEEALNQLLEVLIGTSDFYKKQLRAFSALGRHPLGRVISLSFYGLIPFNRIPSSLSDALSWHPINDIPELSYDHNKILSTAFWRFKKGLLRHPTVFELLPLEFTIAEVIAVFEQAFEQKLDASNFGRQVKSSDLVIALDKFRKNVKNTGRPSRLYSFNQEQYRRHSKDRIQFNF